MGRKPKVVEQLEFEEWTEPDRCICCGAEAVESKKLYKWGLEIMICAECGSAELDEAGRVKCEAHGVREHMVCSEPEFETEGRNGIVYPRKSRRGVNVYMMDYEEEGAVSW